MLSVDFGTSGTTAAFRDTNGRIHDVPLGSGGGPMPSAVLGSPGRILSAGEAAVQSALTDPTAYEPNPKLRVDQLEVNLGGLFLPTADLIAAVVAEALTRAAQTTGEQPGEVVLTYPREWEDRLVARLATGGEIAGIDQHRMRVVDEATAVAAYYSAWPSADRIVVVDLGAANCSAVVLDRGDRGYDVTAADGFNQLGGLDFDARIRGWVIQQLQERNPALAAEAADTSDIAAQLRLADAVRSAKEALSADQSAPVTFTGATGTETVELSRTQFEALIAADVDRAVRLTEALVFHANALRPQSGSVAVHLMGGSSRIPLIQSRFAAVGPVEVADPRAALVHGALMAAPTPEQQRFNKIPEPLPAPVRNPIKRRLRRRAAAKAAAARQPRRKLITATTRKWLAAIALLAIVGSGIGVAAVVIYGSLTAPDQVPQAASPPPLPTLTPRVPTPMDFTVDVVVTEQQCPPEAPTCVYKYTIEPKFVGLHPLPETPFTVFYEVVGGNEPQKGEFTVEKDQARILKDVVLEGSPGAQLRANVLQVAG